MNERLSKNSERRPQQNPPMNSPPQPDWNAAAPDLTGRRLGDYQILRKLGRGGMAEVYLAQQISLHRPVALKVLLPVYAGNENYVRRFLHEARAAAKLVHAHIVQIHEVGRVEGVHFIAQEFVAGKNLKQLLQARGKPLGAAEGVHLLRHVAAALQKAAEQQVVHRDIKPENILLTPGGEAKVADFGLARVAAVGTDQTSLTEVGVTMGTPLYMSPEQVSGKTVDPRSDLYSLGVTAFHMFAGQPPFAGETQLAIAMQHLSAQPPNLADLRHDLPPELCRMVARLLEKSPDARYASASDLLTDLRNLSLAPADDDWLSDLRLDSSGPLGSENATLSAATQQLSRVMAQRPTPAKTSWFIGALSGLACLAVALLLGGFAAWAARPASLLEVSQGKRRQVEQLGNVSAQFIFAQMAETNVEESWKAVERYFPPNGDPQRLRYIRRSKQRLAGWYLEREEYDQALPLYAELARVEATETQFRRIGEAGQAVIYDLLRQPEKVKPLLASLLAGSAAPLDDSTLAPRIEALSKKYFPQGAAP